VPASGGVSCTEPKYAVVDDFACRSSTMADNHQVIQCMP
jgi:hypothetical protein